MYIIYIYICVCVCIARTIRYPKKHVATDWQPSNVHLTYAFHQLNTQHQHHPAPSYSQSCWRIKSLRRRMAGASLLSNNGPGEPEEIWGAPSLKWAPPHTMGNRWKRYQFLSGARSKLYPKYPRILTHRIHGAGIYANIWCILMVNVTIYSIHYPMGYEWTLAQGDAESATETMTLTLENGATDVPNEFFFAVSSRQHKIKSTYWQDMIHIHRS